MVLWVKIKEFAEKYHYNLTEDEDLFRDFMQFMFYYDGVVGIDPDHPPSYYYKPTSYTDGYLLVDLNYNALYYNGELSGKDEIMKDNYENQRGRIWLLDGT